MTNNELKCRYCNEIKNLSSDNFKVEKRTKLGFDSVCRPCRRTERNNHRKSNIDVFLKKEANSRKTKKRLDYQKKYWTENKEELNKNARERYKKNPTPYLIRSKEQKIRMGDDYKKYLKEWRVKNKDYLNQYIKERLKTDINFKLKHTLRGKLRKLVSGKNKTNSALFYLGISVEEFKLNLEKKFYSGMTWDNYGTLWHIDHIMPCKSFDLTIEENRQKCFHHTNLQPLLAVDNLKKLDRLPDGTFARDKLK